MGASRSLGRRLLAAMGLTTAAFGMIVAIGGEAPVGAAPVSVTKSYTGPAVPIEDAADLTGSNPGAVATASLVVSGVLSPITDLDFRIDGSVCSTISGSVDVGLDHTFMLDLDATLESPAGTTVSLFSRTGGSGNNMCQTLLDDEASVSIESVGTADAPFTGSYTPASPLSAFDGENPNGTWKLHVRDSYLGDTGNIRAFSLLFTSAETGEVTATKTVAGTFEEEGAVTYTVVLTNSGNTAVSDRAGHEFVDVLPAGLTLVSATTTYGIAVATVATNTVTWDGELGQDGGQSTITINATVDPGTQHTTITNQGSLSYDSDNDGDNDASGHTDDPAVGGATDPTSFFVGAKVSATKSVSGTYQAGGTVTYTIVTTNHGDAAVADNPGDELTDVLPPGLTLVSATATAGTAVATIATDTVTWNGALGVGEAATITIVATVDADVHDVVISNQATISFDSDDNGTNDASGHTDDPAVGGNSNATSFAVGAPIPITGTDTWGVVLLGLAALVAGTGLALVGRRRPAA
jgi:uncharacterized repeat protein (TIGR01451 family)